MTGVRGALHFFFMGWALPVALSGVPLTVRLRSSGSTVLGLGTAVGEAVTAIFSRSRVVAWNLAVLAVGVGFFYQDARWSGYAFGLGYTVLAALWAYYLAQTARLHRRSPAGEGGVPAGE